VGDVSDQVIPPEVQSAKPSARLLYLLLDVEGACTQQRLRELSALSPSGTRRAINALEDADVVVERPDPVDGRRRRYVLASHLEVPA
jgi:DNA-binding MarR family transcriptional regulator